MIAAAGAPSQREESHIEHVEIPRLFTLARHAGHHILEATLIPLALFYGTLSLIGIWAALIVALAWSYVAIGRRLVTGQRIPGILLLGAFGITARTVLAFATGSVFVYFLQPTLTTVGIAGLFLISLSTGRPLAQRLAADFCPLSNGFLSHPPVQKFFARITLLWGGVQLANAAATVGLLLSQPVHTYVWAKSLVSLVLTGAAIGISTLWFKRSMRRNGIRVVHAPAI